MNSSDPIVQTLRHAITQNDHAIVAAINRRLELVAELWRHKVATGMPMVDANREDSLLRELGESNAGPLSEESLRELYTLILDLTKRQTTPAAPSS